MTLEFGLVLALAVLNMIVVAMMIRQTNRIQSIEMFCGFMLESLFTKCEIKQEYKNEFETVKKMMERFNA